MNAYVLFHELNQTSGVDLAVARCYHPDTDFEVIERLESARRMRTLVRVFYGDTKTGKVEPSELPCCGTITFIHASSSGPYIRIVHISGGSSGPLESERIVGILSQGVGVDEIRRWVYKHPGFDTGKWEVRLSNKGRRPKWQLFHDGKLYATVRGEINANRLMEYMVGARLAP